MKLMNALVQIPARWLVPMVLVSLALLAAGVNYVVQIQHQRDQRIQVEERLLRERLTLEQTRLDVQTGAGNLLLVRRLVTGLGLFHGMDHAYLVQPSGRVVASLSRLDINRPLADVQGKWPAHLRAWQGERLPSAGIQTSRLPDQSRLLGTLLVQDGSRLLVSVDLSQALAEQVYAARRELLREALVIFGVAAVLAALLHLIWFRRASQLAGSLDRMGSGDLAARSGLQGRDELARIGAAADCMAERLQAEQMETRRLNDIVRRSPLVVIEWRNAPGWPVCFVSDAVDQWGYTPADLLDGQLSYNDLIHPDDVQRVNDDIARHFEHGPDDYRQEYRLRCKDGRWVWVDDRTALTRGPAGEVIGISGILLDITLQKDAQQAQREQAELLRMFYELPFLGMAISSPSDKRWLQVNDRLCEMLGYSREELLRMTWEQMTPPKDRERNVQLFDELLAGRRSGYQMQKRFVRKDGSMVHVELDVRAVRDSEGQVRQLFATTQDLTERLRAEKALRQSEERYMLAARIGRSAAWEMWPLEGKAFSDANLARLLGYELEELGENLELWMNTVPEDARAGVAAAMQPVIEGRADSYEIEHPVRRKNGSTGWVLVQGQRVSAPGEVPLRLVGSSLDITERKLASQILLDLKDMLEQAEAVSRLGSWAFDSDTGSLRWSPQMFHNMGMPWSERPPSIDAYCERIHPDDVRPVRAAIDRLVRAQEVPMVEFRTHPAFGPVRWMRRTVYRIPREAEGKGPRYIGILLDITEAVEAEERLRHINQELEARVASRTQALQVANRELEAFSYSVSHDLKAPLRGIDGYSQLLEEEYGPTLDDDGRLFVQRVRQGVRQMGELINDLLEYSRMERRDMAQDPVELAPLIDGVLQNHRADIERLEVEVTLDVPPLTLPLDREGIALVLRNLIGNALKFSAEAKPPRLEIGVRLEPQRRILWVRDNGVGFDMKYHDRIFGIFQRLHRAEEFAGTGVGLALVAKAVQRMGGRVWAESEPGAGATFFLEFPE